MTALAMIIGMVPMALGLGEGGEQNAPLGRAVIGGLLFATVATLFFVPTVFSVLHGSGRSRSAAWNPNRYLRWIGKRVGRCQLKQLRRQSDDQEWRRSASPARPNTG